MSKLCSCVENEIAVCRRNPEEKLINTYVIWPPNIGVEWTQFIFLSILSTIWNLAMKMQLTYLLVICQSTAWKKQSLYFT